MGYDFELSPSSSSDAELSDVKLNFSTSESFNVGDDPRIEIEVITDKIFTEAPTAGTIIGPDWVDVTFSTDQTGNITKYYIDQFETELDAFGNIDGNTFSITYKLEAGPTTYSIVGDPPDNIIIDKTDITFGDDPTVTVTAEEGFYFDDIPSLGGKFGPLWKSADMVTDQTDEYITEYYLDNIETAIDLVEDDFSRTDVVKLMNSTLEKPIVDEFGGYGLINIYQANSSKLEELENADTTTYPLYDYVISLKRLFINVEELQSKEITLGGHNTQVNGDLLKIDTKTLDFGTVEIPEKFGNAGDYTNTEIEIFLPFYGFASLENSKIIGEKINLIYKVNILNGKASILIYDINETLINEFSCEIGYSIPYFIGGSGTTPSERGSTQMGGQLSIRNSHLMGFVPYIITRSYEATQGIYKNDKAVKDFNNLSGFYKFEDVELDQQEMLKSEYDQIKNKLKEGVLF